MSDIVELLAARPDASLKSNGAREAMEWTKALGLDEDYLKESKTRSWAAVYYLNPTHWVIFGLLCNSGQPKLDGRMVLCYPKAKFRREQIEGFVKSMEF